MQTKFIRLNPAISLSIRCEVEIHRHFRGTDTETGVATLFRGAACNVPWNKVTKRRITSLEVIISFFFRYLSWLTGISCFFRHPDPAVISQRFRHQCQLRLMIARNRDASRVDLCITWISEESTFPVCFPGRCYITAHSICREIKNVAVSSYAKKHSVTKMSFEFACDET